VGQLGDTPGEEPKGDMVCEYCGYVNPELGNDNRCKYCAGEVKPLEEVEEKVEDG
jgi:hypothetical protein